MANTFIDIMTITRKAAGAISAHRLVDFAGNQAGADAQVLGVAMTDADAGDDFAVLTIGRITLPAGAAIAVGDALVSDANGQPVPQGTATNVFGHALTAAANPGDPVEVLIK